MNIAEREIDDPEKEGVILEYVNFTKEFAEIKEYVRSKGESIRGYTEKKECVSIRTEDILYFEAVQNKVFAYTSNKFYEIKSRLYQLEEKITRKCMKRASKTTIVNADRIVSVRTALNGRLYVRMEALSRLEMALQKQEQILCKALHTDLGKSKTESVMCEIGLVQGEIRWMKQHLGRLCRQKHVRTPLAQFAAKSYQSPSPYGNVLIMSPWNYPVLLTLEPLVDAIAAGNTAVVKPSAYAPVSANVLKDLLEECFPPEYVAVVLGGREENQALLQEKFDKIFFTGSVAVGKQVMESAARHLTPVTLELGGKSPCIVEKSSKIRLAARRIVFGKFINCGSNLLCWIT